MNFLARSLVAKITVSVALVVATLICVAVGALIHFDIRQAKAMLAAQAALSGRMVSEGVSEAVWNLSPEGVAKALSPLNSAEGFAGAVVLGTQWEVFYATPEADRIPKGDLLTEVVQLTYRDRHGAIRDLGTLHVNFDLRPTMVAVEREIAMLGFGGLLALLLVVWGAVRVTKGVTAPITRMTDVMSDIAAGEVDIVVPNWHRADEIGRMAKAVRTFQRNAFDLREAKETAEQAVLTKAKFLAAASHDLRQPVQSLMMFVNLLRADADRPSLRETVDNLDNVVAALKGLLDSLLDVTRLDAGSVRANPEVTEASTILVTLDSQFGPVARGQGLSFSVTPVSARIMTDRVLLLRLLGNLIDNAIRYTPKGAIEVACVPEGGHLNIEVRDTGIGIPPEQIEAIWDEFHQVGNKERNRDNGIGLGLSIVRRLSGILGHPVQVSSTYGAGSIFSVSVPLAEGGSPGKDATESDFVKQAPPREEPRPKPTPVVPIAMDAKVRSKAVPGGGVDGTCVLIVDDDDIIRNGLGAFLRGDGYVVHAASNGSEALSLVLEEGVSPDVVICDYDLSASQSGIDVIGKLWDAVGNRIPAMLLSGRIDGMAAAAAEALGIEVAVKPIPPNQLSEAVRRLSCQRALLSA